MPFNCSFGSLLIAKSDLGFLEAFTASRLSSSKWLKLRKQYPQTTAFLGFFILPENTLNSFDLPGDCSFWYCLYWPSEEASLISAEKLLLIVSIAFSCIFMNFRGCSLLHLVLVYSKFITLAKRYQMVFDPWFLLIY